MRSFLLAGLYTAVTAVTPVEKVTELLTKLAAKIEEEGQAEAVAYDKFACFCKEQADNKLYAITKSDEKIKKLDAKIEALAAEIEVLDKEVADGNAEIKRLEEESEKELKLRADERAEYEKADASISRAIDAVRRAITALQESRPDSLLIQKAVSFAASTGMDVSRLQALVGQPVDRTKSASGGPQNAYEYHSNEIIELLQRLMKQFKARKEKLFVEESTEKHAFEKVEQARQFEITTTTEAVATASASSAKKSDQKSKATDELNTETSERNSDQEFLDELTKQCENKAKTFDQRSSTRSQELKALSEATALLKGKGGSKYGANKRLNFIQSKKQKDIDADEDSDDDTEEYALTDAEKSADDAETEATAEVEQEDEAEDLSFIQLENVSVNNQRVFNLLRDDAKRLKSTVLTSLALKLKADHFVKVRTLIKDLIARLEAQAEAEATHKDQCDKDMKAAITQRDESQATMESENAAITTNKVTIKELTQEIADLGQSIADAKKALRERTELRSAERAENEKTIADAEEGAQAIRDAVKVLKDFYGEADLVQISLHKQRQEPYKAPKSDRDGNTVGDLATEGSDTFEEEYHGNSDASKGIFGLLNVIRSDYERTIEDTTDLEKVAQDEFEEYEKETNQKIDEYETDRDKAKKAKAEEKDALMENEDDLADATKENDLAKEKLALLKGECVDGAVSHEERVKRREQEIESLKEALNILEEMNFLQKRK